MTIDKRLVLASLLVAALALAFWSGSRYPDLNRKAAVGGSIAVNGLAFDVAVQGNARDPLWTKVAVTAANWGVTNLKGMTFGLLIGAAVLTLLAVLTRRRVAHPVGNSVIGVLIGAPLGLCVNCATPAAHALYRGGAPLETALAALISSPTMNVIVLTMTLSLFPWYLWLTKLLATVSLVTILIPLASRLLFRREQDRAPAAASALESEAATVPCVPGFSEPIRPDDSGWWRSTTWTARTFGANLWWIVRTTVPLMLLAGLLGSVLIVLIPWDKLALLGAVSGRLRVLGAMTAMALLATFLPVPMAFDVVICEILFERGLPAQYVMVLLFTLGTFSIYPFLVLQRAVSLRVASLLFVAVGAIGLASGVTVHFLEEWHTGRQNALIARTLIEESPAPPPELPPSPVAVDDERLSALLRNVPVATQLFHEDRSAGIRIERRAFRASAAADAATLFTRSDGAAFGIDVPFFFSPRTFLVRTTATNRPIASGDVHNDGWPDLLIGADHHLGGLLLFANLGGERFVRQRVDLGAFEHAMVQTAALVDLNGDGWLDIFFTTDTEGNVAVLNHQGRFDGGAIIRLSRDAGTLANAAAFGDLNRDGRLDVVLGDWALNRDAEGIRAQVPAGRLLLSNGDMQYRAATLEGPSGYALTTLLTDFNDDGLLDLIVGNDFKPDNFYLGRGDGTFRRLLASDGIIPASGLNTMSVTSADIDNDLRQEILIAQIATGNNRKALLARRIPAAEAAAEVATASDRERLRNAVTWWPLVKRLGVSHDMTEVAAIPDPWMRQQFACLGAVMMAIRRPPSQWSALVPRRCDASDYVANMMYDTPAGAEPVEGIPIAVDTTQNLLLKAGDGGAFVDRAAALNLAVTDWTWNARFADVDNDGWQDLYAANGWVKQSAWESKMFLRNMGGTTFRDDTVRAGLVDHLPAGGYTYVDVDLDGDLDIVSVPMLGPVRVLINNSHDTHAIEIELRDRVGNSYGIGSKVFIRYGREGELHQMREIQASGGFVSFDAAVAHFGLGDYQSVSGIEIKWSTGETTILSRPFDAGYRYIVHREDTGRGSASLDGLIRHRGPNAAASAAYKWVDIILEVTGREVDRVGARPTIISREMAIPLTAMYEAWAPYDDRAVGTRLGAQLRRPAAERTQRNKETAIAYATYDALVNLFPGDKAWLTGQMRRMGYDPDDHPANPAAPANIGRTAAAAVLEYRRHDGSNQFGDEPGSDGTPYSDHTNYEPKNTWDSVKDPNRWQPIPFSDGQAGQIIPGFLTPHWYKVKPFALESSAQFRPPPVPLVGSPQLQADVDEVVSLADKLTLEQKALVEFMRDGPRSTGQSGHWLQFAQDVSRRDRYGLDQDVKLFFTVGNTAMDAFIAAWEAKRHYDSARPWTLVRHYYAGKKLDGYLGPCRGFGAIAANEWHPYSPATFVTPPFPGYPSGHSAVSGASSKMLELLTGSDRFGAYAMHTAGIYTEPGCSPRQMQARGGRADATVTTAEVVLMLPTFSKTAEMAGLSRVLGGYHIQSDNTGGLNLGRALAVYSWPKYRAYFDGTKVSE